MLRAIWDSIRERYRELTATYVCDECGVTSQYNRLAYPYCLRCAVDMSGEEDMSLYQEGGFYD